jgi:hypothetical protein
MKLTNLLGAYYGAQYITDDYIVAADQGVEEPGPQKEIPPPSVFETEEAELKWIAVKSRVLNEKANEVVRSSLVEPRGKRFWPGTISQNDVEPLGCITESSMEDYWKRDGPQIILIQRTAIWTILSKEDTDKTQILDCRKKRRGDDLINQEKVKKRKVDLATEVERLRALQKKSDIEAKVEASNDESGRLAARRRAERDAGIASLAKREGISTAEAEQRLDAAENEHLKRWNDLNKQRHKEHKPKLPGREPLTAAQIAKVAEESSVRAKNEADRKENEENEKARILKEAREKLEQNPFKPKGMVKNEFANTTNLSKKEEEQKAKDKVKKEEEEDDALALSTQQLIDADNALTLAMEEKHTRKGQLVDEWNAVESKGGRIPMEFLTDEEQIWYAEYLSEKEQSKPVPPKPSNPNDLHDEIKTNLNGRAATSGITPAQYVKVNYGLPSVEAYVDKMAKEIYALGSRTGATVAEEQFRSGLMARFRLTGRLPDHIAKVHGYANTQEYCNALIGKLKPWTFAQDPIPEIKPGDPDYEDYQAKVWARSLLVAKDLVDWKENNQMLLEEIGDYEAEVLLADRKREKHDPTTHETSFEI